MRLQDAASAANEPIFLEGVRKMPFGRARLLPSQNEGQVGRLDKNLGSPEVRPPVGLPFRTHSSALKTATSVVHAFNKRKRKGQAKRPRLKKPSVTLSPYLFKVSFDGK